jgi:hypothetical protein
VQGNSFADASRIGDGKRGQTTRGVIEEGKTGEKKAPARRCEQAPVRHAAREARAAIEGRSIPVTRVMRTRTMMMPVHRMATALRVAMNPHAVAFHARMCAGSLRNGDRRRGDQGGGEHDTLEHGDFELRFVDGARMVP